MSIANEGSTKAFNVRTYGVISIVKEKKGGRFEIGFQQDVPGTISNTDDGKTVVMYVHGFGLYGGAEYRAPILTNAETAKAIGEGKMFLQVSGLLQYTDIFEDRHELPFKCIWVGDDTGGPWRTMSKWYDLNVTEEEVDEDRTWDASALEE